MIVRTLQAARKTKRRVTTPHWESTRLLLKSDNVGFSFHITTIYAGAKLRMRYSNHFESVYCISGEGQVQATLDGAAFPIEPGTIYILDRHDDHILRAHTEMILACVFNPALHGREVHDETGAYPLDAEEVSDA